MKKYLVMVAVAMLLLGCNNKKPVDDRLYQEGLEMAKQKTERLPRERFIKEYEALDGYEKDSVFYITLTEVREGTDLDKSAMETYEAARRKGVYFKACVILDKEGKEIGRYE